MKRQLAEQHGMADRDADTAHWMCESSAQVSCVRFPFRAGYLFLVVLFIRVLYSAFFFHFYFNVFFCCCALRSSWPEQHGRRRLPHVYEYYYFLGFVDSFFFFFYRFAFVFVYINSRGFNILFFAVEILCALRQRTTWLCWPMALCSLMDSK